MADRSEQLASTHRIPTLDVLRGVAVMGILVANLPAFGLPEAAYFSPRAWGGTAPADLIAWFVTFVFVEGKMRGLFTLLFGASMLLVVERAEAAGENPVAVHLRRMAVLFVVGCLHLYLIWWGDILSHYALVGVLALPFVRLPARWLVAIGVALIAVQTALAGALLASLLASTPRASPEQVATWNAFAAVFGTPPRAELLAEITATRGPFLTEVAWRWRHALSPLTFLPIGGAESLGYMLFGMAGLKSGMLRGAWPRRRYRRLAAIGLGISLPCYVVLAYATMAHGFDLRWVTFASVFAATPVRPAMVMGYAALVVLVMRPGSWLTGRIAAAGRAAFTNYLGTSVAMTAVFDGWGLGWFGALSRAQLYLFALPVWAAMLAWSAPWLAHHRYGPLEWLWRSLARGRWQPMRGAAAQ